VGRALSRLSRSNAAAQVLSERNEIVSQFLVACLGPLASEFRPQLIGGSEQRAGYSQGLILRKELEV
jgi:hypothetical protein